MSKPIVSTSARVGIISLPYVTTFRMDVLITAVSLLFHNPAEGDRREVVSFCGNRDFGGLAGSISRAGSPQPVRDAKKARRETPLARPLVSPRIILCCRGRSSKFRATDTWKHKICGYFRIRHKGARTNAPPKRRLLPPFLGVFRKSRLGELFSNIV